MTDREETLNAIALSRVSFYNLDSLVELYHRVGSATRIAEASQDIRRLIPDASPRMVEVFRDFPALRTKAEAELQWDEAHGVDVLTMDDPRYPQRLSHCADAPLVLFYKGNANLNQSHIINIVGTRRCTVYGQDLIRHFIADLKDICPNLLIVSGLAYGVDINAHRNALENGFETVGVLAHGLDELYPPRHRDTAKQMIHQGGLLTEYTTCTNPDKMNFVRRNRIVAGMCDATILVESAVKGGGLITCRMARDYGRDVFAFPGNVGAEYSAGCNNLIRDDGARMITSAQDFVHAMGWENEIKVEQARKQGIERQLFPNLNAEEQRVVAALQKQNDQQANVLSVACEIPISKLSSTLFAMEMKGIVKQLAGSCYHLLG